MNWITKKILELIAGQIHKRLKKRNWVTKTGGVSLILSGLAMILSGFAGDKLDVDLILTGIAIAGGGITALGARRAIEDAKLTDEEKRRLLE